jgi:3-oxoacyl-[acyl-carrier protein] reductase
MSLERKVAFVSGASRTQGNGKAIAIALARNGAEVAVSGKSHMEGAMAVANEIKAMGRKAIAVKMDVSKYEDVRNGFAQIKKELGPISIVVNNAALMNHNVSIAKTTIEEWDDEVQVCLHSAFYCIKEAWSDMCTNKWGRVINITSVAGVMGGFGQSSYGSAKAGLISLCKTVALEGARFNITGNCVLVGISETDAYHTLSEAVRQKLEQRTVFKKPAQPQDIANAVAYLASEEASYMTGTIMNMLGGLDLFVF